MSGVGNQMSNLGAEVFPDGPTHVMNQIYQLLLHGKQQQQKNTSTSFVQRGKINTRAEYAGHFAMPVVLLLLILFSRLMSHSAYLRLLRSLIRWCQQAQYMHLI